MATLTVPHITSAISLHLLFALSLLAYCWTPSARSPEYQSGFMSIVSWKLLRLEQMRSQMKPCNAARGADRCYWRVMEISGGYSRILKWCFYIPNICSMTLYADVCWQLNSLFLLVGIECSSLAKKCNLMNQRHTKVGHGPTLWGGSNHPGKEWWVVHRWEVLHLLYGTSHTRWEDQW